VNVYCIVTYQNLVDNYDICKAYSKIHIDKNLNSIHKGLKQGDALTSLLFNLALKYAISKVEGKCNGLELKGTH